MKTYTELSATEQAYALNKCVARLLTAICEGQIRFNDTLNHDDLQARIDAAFAKSEHMQTPWFAAEYIMDTCSDEITSTAQCDAEDALYNDTGATIIELEGV